MASLPASVPRADEHARRLDIGIRLLKILAIFTVGLALIYGLSTVVRRQFLAKPEMTATGGETQAAPPPMDALEPLSLWQDADLALETFLEAADLGGRMRVMEVRTSEEELAASCLNKPLPPVLRMVPEFREPGPGDTGVDWFYTVEFKTNDKLARTQTLWVRARHGSPPKVMADAFLDTYGGRLAHFATNSSDLQATFHAVAYAMDGCEDGSIPNHAEKLTLTLKASDHGVEIARAFFSRESELARGLQNGDGLLAFGNAKHCLVKLRWNSTEDPGRPFLEVRDVRDRGSDP